MYEAFYGLSQRPFAAAPQAKAYFPAASVDAARQTLARCIDRCEGAGLLIGPPGAGKTLLLQVLAQQFAERLAVASISGGAWETRKELLQALLFELKLPYQGMGEGEMRLSLVEHLSRGEHCPSGVLLLVDEAHKLSPLLLEELRTTTDVSREGEPLVRLVLAGTMELEEQFAEPQLAAFSQRLAARCYLEHFDRAETADYLRFQVAVAGGQAERVFDSTAIESVYRATDGIPRLVNQLCDHALLMAYASERRPVRGVEIEAAWADLQQFPAPAADGDGAADGQSVIEFGEWEDEAEAPSAPMSEAPPVQAVENRQPPSRPQTCGVSARVSRMKRQGIQFCEDDDKLQVVVDPYANLDELDEDECEEEALDQCLAALPTAKPASDDPPGKIEQDLVEAMMSALDDQIPPSRTDPAASPAPVSAAGRESVEEEIVADPYARLDAQSPQPASAQPAPPETATPPPAAPALAAAAERVPLSEAIHHRIAAEASQSVAQAIDEGLAPRSASAPPAVEPEREPPPIAEAASPKHGTAFDEQLQRMLSGEGGDLSAPSHAEHMAARLLSEAQALKQCQESTPQADQVVDPEPAVLRDDDAPTTLSIDGDEDDHSDMLVIEDDAPHEQETPSRRRVKRLDYKQLFARLRRG